MYIPFTFLSNVNLAFNGVVEYLVVGGGGGGGMSFGGGGGAGGVLTGSVIIAPNTTYNLLVGAGGPGSDGSSLPPYGNGSLSLGFNYNYISTGGGKGGDLTQTGSDGGSGGGGGGTTTRAGGLGIVGQGFNGGSGRSHPTEPGTNAGGGGGGARANGGDVTIFLLDSFAGNGGDGVQWLDGNYYGGGGGGCGSARTNSPGAGGLGGGGIGSNGNFNNPAGDGSPNSGGGGGGGRSTSTSPAGDGGSGIIKIRYTGAAKASGGNITFDGVYTTHTFNSSSAFQTFAFILPSGSVPVLPSNVYYNVTQCNETSSFNIDVNTVWTPNTTVYSTGSVLYLTGSISGCFTINSSIITSSLSGSTAVTIQNSYNTCDNCFNGYPNFPISSSLVIWNALSGLTGSTWYDYSNNGNNGTISGTTLTLSGSLGYAFNGTNNYVTYPTTLVAEPSSSYTLQYYGTLPSESTNRDFFVKGYYNDGWDTIYRGSDTKDFVYRGEAGFDKVSAAITPVYAQKQLITIRVDSTTNLMDLYVNNTSLGNFSRIGYINEFNTGTIPLAFGWNIDGDSTYWKGAVSDLLVFNKVLSATEISQSYAYLSSL
jgi:hypothetical protein